MGEIHQKQEIDQDYISCISIVNFEPIEHIVMASLVLTLNMSLTDAFSLPLLFHWFLDCHSVDKRIFKTIHENHRLAY